MSGMTLLSNPIPGNKELFKSIKAFYFGICHDDSRNTDTLVIAMYERANERLFVKVLNRKDYVEVYGFIYFIDSEKSVELKKAEINKSKLSFEHLPLKLRYFDGEYCLVDYLKLGPTFDVP